jgi:hypothetical protein
MLMGLSLLSNQTFYPYYIYKTRRFRVLTLNEKGGEKGGGNKPTSENNANI